MGQHNFQYGIVTETAGTPIIRTIPRRALRYARVTTLRYRPQGTVHTVTGLKALGSTTVVSGGTAGQAKAILTADPGPDGNGIAAGDYITFQLPDGTTFQSTVNAWNAGTLEVTLDDNFPTGGVDAGALVWDHGVAADQTDNQFRCVASTVNTFQEDPSIGVIEGGLGEPLVLYSDNATADGFLEQVSGIYARE